jgi:hypothetical protein
MKNPRLFNLRRSITVDKSYFSQTDGGNWDKDSVTISVADADVVRIDLPNGDNVQLVVDEWQALDDFVTDEIQRQIDEEKSEE